MTGRIAPKPANFDALVDAAAHDDAVRFAAESARYRQQLVDAGVEAPRMQGWLEDGEVS